MSPIDRTKDKAARSVDFPSKGVRVLLTAGFWEEVAAGRTDVVFSVVFEADTAERMLESFLIKLE